MSPQSGDLPALIHSNSITQNGGGPGEPKVTLNLYVVQMDGTLPHLDGLRSRPGRGRGPPLPTILVRLSTVPRGEPEMTARLTPPGPTAFFDGDVFFCLTGLSTLQTRRVCFERARSRSKVLCGPSSAPFPRARLWKTSGGDRLALLATCTGRRCRWTMIGREIFF